MSSRSTRSFSSSCSSTILLTTRPTPQTTLSPSSGSGALVDNSHGKWGHDLHHRANPAASRISKFTNSSINPAVARSLKNNRLFAALHGGPVAATTTPSPSTFITTAAATANAKGGGGLHIRGGANSSPSTGFQIRGSAAPAVVQASNFAPGTTAEDIKHAMAPIGNILSCIVLTSNPSVISEIVFEKREAAEACIRQYNGQRADGMPPSPFPPVAGSGCGGSSELISVNTQGNCCTCFSRTHRPWGQLRGRL